MKQNVMCPSQIHEFLLLNTQLWRRKMAAFMQIPAFNLCIIGRKFENYVKDFSNAKHSRRIFFATSPLSSEMIDSAGFLHAKSLHGALRAALHGKNRLCTKHTYLVAWCDGVML